VHDMKPRFGLGSNPRSVVSSGPRPDDEFKRPNISRRFAPGGVLHQDVEFVENVRRALQGTGQSALQHVDVLASARTIILRGRVPSYSATQTCRAVALRVGGRDPRFVTTLTS
jgi:hypothetical protein